MDSIYSTLQEKFTSPLRFTSKSVVILYIRVRYSDSICLRGLMRLTQAPRLDILQHFEALGFGEFC